MHANHNDNQTQMPTYNKQFKDIPSLHNFSSGPVVFLCLCVFVAASPGEKELLKVDL